MCTISGTCGCSGGNNTVLGAMFGVAAGWLLRALWSLAKLIFAGLVALLVWATPRAWRLSVRVTRAGRRRWTAYRLTRAAAQAPVASIEAPLMTLSDLLDKQSAEVVR